MKFTNEQIEDSIKTGRLNLDRDNTLRFYRGGSLRLGLYFILPVFLLYLLVDNFPLWMVAAALLISLAVFGIATIVKYRSLRLTKTETSLEVKRLRKLIAAVAKTKEWKVANNRNTLIVLKTGPGRSGGNAGGGERITLIIRGKQVWLSSISDPDRTMSVKSLARNRENVGTIISVLKGRLIPASVLDADTPPTIAD